jgi:hypothetical protein
MEGLTAAGIIVAIVTSIAAIVMSATSLWLMIADRRA